MAPGQVFLSVLPARGMHADRYRYSKCYRFWLGIMRLLAIWRSEHAFRVCWLKPSAHFTFIKFIWCNHDSVLEAQSGLRTQRKLSHLFQTMLLEFLSVFRSSQCLF